MGGCYGCEGTDDHCIGSGGQREATERACAKFSYSKFQQNILLPENVEKG